MPPVMIYMNINDDTRIFHWRPRHCYSHGRCPRHLQI